MPIDGVVTVPAGLTEFDVRIASIDDEVYEGPENFTVDVTGLTLSKVPIRVAQPLLMMVRVLIPIRMMTVQRYLSVMQVRLTKAIPLTLLSR